MYYFRDWPNTKVPKIAVGVYTIWQNTKFVYVGMAGGSLSAEVIANHRQTGKAIKGL
jgi:hypothetical protein